MILKSAYITVASTFLFIFTIQTQAVLSAKIFFFFLK